MRFEGVYNSLSNFVRDNELEKEADNLFGDNWEEVDEDQGLMIEEALSGLVEENRNFYWVDMNDCGDYEVTYSHSDETLYELRKNLKLALLQLQTYSDNDLIIAEGETRSIPELLEELNKEGV